MEPPRPGEPRPHPGAPPTHPGQSLRPDLPSRDSWPHLLSAGFGARNGIGAGPFPGAGERGGAGLQGGAGKGVPRDSAPLLGVGLAGSASASLSLPGVGVRSGRGLRSLHPATAATPLAGAGVRGRVQAPWPLSGHNSLRTVGAVPRSSGEDTPGGVSPPPAAQTPSPSPHRPHSLGTGLGMMGGELASRFGLGVHQSLTASGSLSQELEGA